MPILKQGSSGPDVKDLQQKLRDHGFDQKAAVTLIQALSTQLPVASARAIGLSLTLDCDYHA